MQDHQEELKAHIKQQASNYHKETIANRRYLHANPELSFHEHNTMRYVAEKLEAYGIAFTSGVADTGLVGLIKGEKNGDSKTIALRADMDALPIKELNEVEYKSKNEGIMHACGHDAHTASLLTCARILQESKAAFSGDIKLIFQPAEERFPGGASLMIKEGVLENPSPVSIIGQHVHPPLETGKVGFRTGPYMAAADELYFTVKGKGGHAAKPHLVIDPILMSAQLIQSLQRVVSRFTRPDLPAVLSIGKVIANGATNIIPDEVKLEGTFRSFDSDLRKAAHDEIRKIAAGVAASFGGEIEADVRIGYPSLYNHEALTSRTRKWAEAFLGQENVVDLELSLGGEDFAYYSQVRDACFYRLGTGNKSRGITSDIHTSTFDIDEKALEIGPGLMAWIAVNELSY
ncbi:MAG: amidohydrolase [Limisphaerales bacterium]|jgi:amidohydrolase